MKDIRKQSTDALLARLKVLMFPPVKTQQTYKKPIIKKAK